MSMVENMDVEPKVRIKKAKFSALWDHFSDNGSDQATCNWCFKTLSYKGGSIFNLKRHLRLQHPTVPCGSGRPKISRILKIDLACGEKVNALHSKQSSQEIRTENNCEEELNVVGVKADYSMINPKQGGGMKEQAHELDVGEESYVSESPKEVLDKCGAASLGLMEAELLKMAQEEHKTKMEVLLLKKRYLELKVSRLEKGNAE